MFKKAKPIVYPPATIWGCSNGHFYTRESGPNCPKCGCGLKYPQAATAEVNNPTPPPMIEQDKGNELVISDGAVPQTSASAVTAGGAAGEPEESGATAGATGLPNLTEMADPNDLAVFGLTKCEFGHVYSYFSSVCCFCADLDNLDGGKRTAGTQETSIPFVQSSTEDPEPSEPEPGHFNPFRMPKLEFYATGWSVAGGPSSRNPNRRGRGRGRGGWNRHPE